MSSSPLAAVLGAFNGAVLMVGGLLAAYTIFTGILNTAHEGEILGKRWSTAYLPLRIGLGSAVLLPVQNGVCLMQLIVVWIAMMGSALGNNVWSAFINNFPAELNQSVIIAKSDGSQKSAVDMTRSWVCLISLNYHSGGAFTGNPMSQATSEIQGDTPYISTTSQTPTQYRIHYGANQARVSANSGIGAYPCGTASIRLAQTSSSGVNNTQNGTASATAVAFNNLLQTAQSAAGPADIAAFQALNTSTQTVAGAYLKTIYGGTDINYANAGNGVNASSTLNAAAQTYDQAVSQAMSTAAASAGSSLTAALKAQMGQDGWMSAGAWYMQLATLQNAYNGMAQNSPSVGGLGTNGMDSSIAAQVKADVDLFDLYISNNGESSGLTTAATPTPNAGADDDDGDGVIDTLKHILHALNQTSFIHKAGDLWTMVLDKFQSAEETGTNAIITTVGQTNADPLMTIQSAGGIVMGVADVTALADATLGYVVSKPIADLMAAFTAFCYTEGLTLELIVPFTPYLIWIGTVVGWMVLVLEALVGASLWACAHLHPDADGIAGRAGQGYGLVLALALRPALMVLGLVFAMMLIYPVAALVNSTFIPAYQSVIGNFHSGPFVFLAVIGVYCSLMMTVVKKTFDLIWFIPDNVLRWFAGLNSTQLGDSGRDVAQGAVGGAQGAIGQGVGGGTMGQTAVNARERKKRDERNKAEAKGRRGGGGSDGDGTGGGSDGGGRPVQPIHGFSDPNDSGSGADDEEDSKGGVGTLAGARERQAAKTGHGSGPSNGPSSAGAGSESATQRSRASAGSAARTAPRDWSDSAFVDMSGDKKEKDWAVRVRGKAPAPGTVFPVTRENGEIREVVAGSLIREDDEFSYLSFKSIKPRTEG